MTHDIESTFDAWQKFLAVGAIIGSGGLAVQNVLDSLGIRGPIFLVIFLTSLSGWTLFGVAVFKIRTLGRTDEGREYIEQAQRDERLDAIRAQAFRGAFFGMLLVQVVGIIIDVIVPGLITVTALATTSIAAGVAVSVVMFHRISDR